jgi:hypothetical protein
MPQAPAETLQKSTLQGFQEYIRAAEEAMDQSLRDGRAFLWADGDAERARQVRKGEIVALFWSGHGPAKVPQGLIHDWIGGARADATTNEAMLRLIQNYDNHANIYQPEVIASKLLSRKANDFEIYLRLLKKKIITVVLDTEHHVEYRPAGKARWTCRSYTTRIAEVERAGKPNEEILAPDTGYGFLWRLYSYWRFEEREGGVDFECRAISLTRDIPLGLGWVIEPIVEKLPKESLIHTLECTRQGLRAQAT